MDLSQIDKAAPNGADKTTFVEHSLSKSYTYMGVLYTPESRSVPRVVAIKDRYSQAVKAAIRNGTPKHELPTLADVIRHDREQQFDDADLETEEVEGHAARPDEQGHADPATVPPTTFADGQAGTGPKGDEVVLGDDFPHVAKLREQKVTTYGEARAVAAHTDLEGIGDRRWDEIQDALKA